jgi:hypothetical protein
MAEGYPDSSRSAQRRAVARAQKRLCTGTNSRAGSSWRPGIVGCSRDAESMPKPSQSLAFEIHGSEGQRTRCRDSCAFEALAFPDLGCWMVDFENAQAVAQGAAICESVQSRTQHHQLTHPSFNSGDQSIPPQSATSQQQKSAFFVGRDAPQHREQWSRRSDPGCGERADQRKCFPVLGSDGRHGRRLWPKPSDLPFLIA